MSYRKKLIEVALPLEAINIASAREKSIRHGHPSTLHLWWARRPLAAARAVIFSQMVDDPSGYVDELLADAEKRQKAEREHRKQVKVWETRKQVFDKAEAWSGSGPNPTPDPGTAPTLEGVAAQIERERLFAIIEQLVLWENTTNEKVLQAARDEIWRSWRRTCAQNANHPRVAELFNPEKLPAFHDPFAGGGALPLEAQRLGLESYASDLNPVAVLINKAMIEIPPKFAGQAPVNPKSRQEMTLMKREWKGAQGLAEDVHYYSQWMRDEAEKRIGHLYPKVEITAEMAQERPDLKQYMGQKLTVIAWIWARTVKSPNPAFTNVDVPLASTFMLSTKEGKEAYVEPIIDEGGYRFTVKIGKPTQLDLTKNGTKSNGSHSVFLCLMSGVPMPFDYIRTEAKAGRVKSKLMAVIAEGQRGRVYLPPSQEMETIAWSAKPSWKPDIEICHWPGRTNVVEYGLTQFGDLFTDRQLVAINTLSDLVQEAHQQIQKDSIISDRKNDAQMLVDGGLGVMAYADAVAIYLSFLVSQVANHSASVCGWNSANSQMRAVFARQAIPMVWDYAESNLFCDSSGSFNNLQERLIKGFTALGNKISGYAIQADANNQTLTMNKVVSTDPPYYDNIEYADLSDFFYVWLRRTLKAILPGVFVTLAVPKSGELVANPYRHGGRENAETFFLEGMEHALANISGQSHPSFPTTIYYAFKQSETESETGTSSTGWEIFLEALLNAGFAVGGTWPMRTEKEGRVIGNDSNALASSIIVVCRPSAKNARAVARGEFVNALKSELPAALAHLQAGNIAPVDLAQAAIGPGMAVYTRYAKVLDAQGQPLTVRQALALINETLDEALAEQEGDFDADTRWALAWFEQNGFAEGEYGVAETLSKAKDTSVNGMVEAGIISSGKGKVRLLKPAELPTNWDPTKDVRLTAWEMVHQLIRVLEGQGEAAAAALEAKLGAQAETARELCYRLYTICERKKRNAEALSYNALVQSWPEITRLARENIQPSETQAPLF